MRKAINRFTLVFFIWLVLDAFNVIDMFLEFLLAGAIPGTNIILPANFMLALLTTLTFIVIFEVLARHIQAFKHVRLYLLNIPGRMHLLSRYSKRA